MPTTQPETASADVAADPADEGATRSAGRRHVLVQATIAPIDADGRFAGVIGTLLFSIAAVVIAILQQARADAVPYWLPWVALTGVGLGLMYLAYCGLRRFDAAAHRPRR